MDGVKSLYRGRHLELVAEGKWEYVRRTGVTGVVGILPITDDGQVVLVEQHRIPVGQRVLELPAGLAGDIQGAEQEPMVEAAKRELLEETGYTASNWVELGIVPVSAGLTSEAVHLFIATGLDKVGPGGGDASEDIEVCQLPIAQIHEALMSSEIMVDAKIAGALFLASKLGLIP